MRRREIVTGALGFATAGALPALAQQQPARARLIGTKTAKALGLTVPATLVARADEMIE